MVASHNSERRIRRRSQAGLTLIEVLIAIVVIGVVVGSTIVALRSGFSMIQLARDNTMASQIMQSEMENLRLMNWAQLGQLPEESEFEVDTLLDANIAARYERVRRVTEVREGMREVELVVQWQTVSGSRHTRAYRTLFSQEGLNDYYYRAFN